MENMEKSAKKDLKSRKYDKLQEKTWKYSAKRKKFQNGKLKKVKKLLKFEALYRAQSKAMKYDKS